MAKKAQKNPHATAAAEAIQEQAPPPGKVLALEPGRLRQLREQYRDALEAERRAAAKRKNTKEEREAAEEQLIRIRENREVGEGVARELKATGHLTDLLIKERTAEDLLKAARKDLKAATIAYCNHIDESL